MKDSFAVQYSLHLWLQTVGVSASGPLGLFIIFVASRILGSMLDNGLILLDIQIDKMGEALRSDQWRAAALKAYQKATAKLYSEAEKDAIRQEYIDALSKYATYKQLSDNQNP